MEKQPKKTDEELLKDYYRNTFSTVEGQKVLQDILVKGGIYSEIKDDEDRIRENFCKDILYMAGGMKVVIPGINS